MVEFYSVDECAASVTSKLNGRYNLKITQAYVPTSSYVVMQRRETQNSTKMLCRKGGRAKYNVIMGDFKAKTGKTVLETAIALLKPI